jgi:hypothetical protein
MKFRNKKKFWYGIPALSAHVEHWHYKTPCRRVLEMTTVAQLVMNFPAFYETRRIIKLTAFWDIDLCSHVKVDRRFRGAYCLTIREICSWRLYAPLKRQLL